MCSILLNFNEFHPSIFSKINLKDTETPNILSLNNKVQNHIYLFEE